ncbi:MAG: MFS transporter, partial [Actinomycetota bacterium]
MTDAAAATPTPEAPSAAQSAASSAAPSAAAPATGIFRSLENFNARLYFSALLLSTIGSWLQLTATSYLVYRLTGKASDLGY